MTLEIYRFKVGTFDCISINDGYVENFAAKGFFAHAPEDALEQAFREHHIDSVDLVLPCNCLFVNTGQHRVLVDTGAGAVFREGFGQLMVGLQAEGIAPGDIDLVVLSHGHWDHVGGNTDSTGKPTFPNARYVMARGEWLYWTSDDRLVGVDSELVEFFKFMRRNLVDIPIELVDPEVEVAPGICLVPAPGHTANHCAIEFTSGEQRLFCMMDIADHPIHIEHVEWCPNWDADHEQAVRTRRQLYPHAEKALVHGYHFAFPGLGHITPDGAGWCWQATE